MYNPKQNHQAGGCMLTGGYSAANDTRVFYPRAFPFNIQSRKILHNNTKKAFVLLLEETLW